MPTESLNSNEVSAKGTSLLWKMSNILVSPGEVFEEIANAPATWQNWLVPTLLVSFAATAVAIPPMAGGSVGAPSGREAWLVMSDVVCGVLAGTLWSALVLWLMGRFCLMARFSYWKALEVAGLAGTILLLGTLVTVLLTAISGDEFARPALSIFAGKLNAYPTLRAMLGVLDVFHLWTAGVLSVGLSKLSGVSFKECAFWVFGFWVVARLALIVMA
jgi:Yip1-like protein